MKRFVLIQGGLMALYIDGKRNGVFEYRIQENETAAQIVEYVRIYGDQV